MADCGVPVCYALGGRITARVIERGLLVRRVMLGLTMGWLAIPLAVAGSAGADAAVSHGAFHRAGGAGAALQESSNWSGIAVTGKTYTQVKGSWTVPTAESAGGARYAADWVGIGGYSTGDLIQAGTSEQFVNGTASYNAWTEILPAAEVVIPGFSVHPGDRMTVNITKGSGINWTIVVTDSTSGTTFTKKLKYASAEASAEWIHEAPTVNGVQATLATTTTVDFDLGTVNGSTVIGSAGTRHRIQLVGSTDATPSTLDSDKDGFADADGTTAPSPPPS